MFSCIPRAFWVYPVSYTHLDVYKRQDEGYADGTVVKEGEMPEKTVYTITDKGRARFAEMCIRDRLRVLVGHVAVAHDGLGERTERMHRLRNTFTTGMPRTYSTAALFMRLSASWSVSYTHLDVYKRQALVLACSLVPSVALAGEGGGTPVPITIETVSYTHLNHRQGPAWQHPHGTGWSRFDQP